MERTLIAHADIAAKLSALFHARFDPARTTATRRRDVRARDRGGDRRRREPRRGPHPARLPLRRPRDAAHELLPAGRRRPKPYLSFKLDPSRIPLVPAAAAALRDLRALAARRGRAPARRHRRARRPALVGPARGLPHRDPRADEGADGQERADRAGRREGRLRRQAPPATRGAREVLPTFISGLLDVTDTIADGEVVPPRDVVRHDGDDPYLVVAADKGTATFSDTANGIAQEYGFWLGDAFASGGSVGYDHKAMGITARSAWVSVQRHFRELGVDVQAEDFTVVGVGDMSGDVFGNGMLLSQHIRLIGAFDHRHVFLDPDPDAAAPRRAPAAVRAAALLVGRLRARADLRGRRRVPAHREVDPAVAAGARGARRRGRAADAERADPGDAARAGRPALERRHRHVREGVARDPRRRRRQGQRRRPRRRARAARRSSARAATSASRSAGGSSSRSPAAASTPTRSTTRAASTAPTTRSTSRSCSTRSSPTAT